MNKFIANIVSNLGKAAFKSAELSANTTCMWISHQPKTPKNLKKYTKK